jgi:hypothetical protein
MRTQPRTSHRLSHVWARARDKYVPMPNHPETDAIRMHREAMHILLGDESELGDWPLEGVRVEFLPGGGVKVPPGWAIQGNKLVKIT